MVLLAESAGTRLVLKQSLDKLRVEQDWYADRSRIRRECAALRDLAPLMPKGAVPTVLWEDAANSLFVMTAAGEGARDWKSLLLAGEASEEIAACVGSMLAAQIRVSWQSAEWRERFGDRTNFEQLRLDPYYRATAGRHRDLAPRFHRLIDDCLGRPCALTHGDWSPKNFLVEGDAVMAIDYEVIHFGDPSFDAAFLLNHLVLKSFHRPALAPALSVLARRFWETLRHEMPRSTAWFEVATVEHLGCLMLARVDGKSPAEYLSEDDRAQVRQFARRLILDRPSTVTDVFLLLGRGLNRSSRAHGKG